MFRNYFRTAIYTLLRNKSFSIINITGLTLGISATLLMMIYVINEVSYEKFHKNHKSVYRLAVEFGSDENKMKFAGAMPALGPAVKETIPEAVSVARIRKEYDAVVKDSSGSEFPEANFFYADREVFEIFSFELIQGNKNDVLKDPFTAVISESTARKYFGIKPALGKVLTFQDKPFKIEGVMKDVPGNTHLVCDLLMSYSTLKSLGLMPDQPWNNWGNDLTYFLLKQNVKPGSLVSRLNKLLSDNAGQWLASKMKFDLQPLDEIHWEVNTRGDLGNKGNRTYVIIFLSVAILILIIACFNYLNLSVSTYLERLTEIAVRKSFGAGRKAIFSGFIIESLIIIVISGLMSYLIFELIYPRLYSYLGIADVLKNQHFLIVSFTVFIVLLITSVFSGVYPALYISGFSPIGIFRKDPQGLPGRLTLRKLLIILQFSISFMLISCTILIFRQLQYINKTDTGFGKSNVVLVKYFGSAENIQKYDLFCSELHDIPGIISVSSAYTFPGVNSRMNIGVNSDTSAGSNSVVIQALPADYGFVRTMGLEIVKGRDFSKEFAADRSGSVILNEAAVRALSLKDPIGTRLNIPGEDHKNGVYVTGVVKDFNLRSFHEKINPLLIYIDPSMATRIAIRLSPGDSFKTLGLVRDKWKAVFPGIAFESDFLSDVYNRLYEPERKSGILLLLFTVLAIIVAGMGLTGFSALATARRIKEVGIRKVLGGQSYSVTLLLIHQYIVWLVVSGLIACPLVMILANKWLGNFAFHTTIPWWIFPVSLLAVFIIALVATGWQSLRAATRNPVEALRYE